MYVWYYHTYVIIWFSGINSASNADMKTVIVRDVAKHCYSFIPALRALVNSRYLILQ